MCVHGAISDSGLHLIGPEDTQLYGLKITQPPKLGTQVTPSPYLEMNYYIQKIRGLRSQWICAQMNN